MHRSARHAPKNAPIRLTLAPLVLSPKKPIMEAATPSYTLGLCRAGLYPEQRVRVAGLKPEVDAIEWLIADKRHPCRGRCR